jgi:hypothetical protein
MKPNEVHLQELDIVSFVLGLADTNAYLIADPASKLAVVIDPAWDGDLIYREAEQRGWRINQIWLTHAHFDHFGGAGAISDASKAPVPVALHADDHSLWRMGGGAYAFGISEFDTGPEPTVYLEHGMKLALGSQDVATLYFEEASGAQTCQVGTWRRCLRASTRKFYRFRMRSSSWSVMAQPLPSAWSGVPTPSLAGFSSIGIWGAIACGANRNLSSSQQR